MKWSTPSANMFIPLQILNIIYNLLDYIYFRLYAFVSNIRSIAGLVVLNLFALRKNNEHKQQQNNNTILTKKKTSKRWRKHRRRRRKIPGVANRQSPNRQSIPSAQRKRLFSSTAAEPGKNILRTAISSLFSLALRIRSAPTVFVLKFNRDENSDDKVAIVSYHELNSYSLSSDITW